MEDFDDPQGPSAPEQPALADGVEAESNSGFQRFEVTSSAEGALYGLTWRPDANDVGPMDDFGQHWFRVAVGGLGHSSLPERVFVALFAERAGVLEHVTEYSRGARLTLARGADMVERGGSTESVNDVVLGYWLVQKPRWSDWDGQYHMVVGAIGAGLDYAIVLDPIAREEAINMDMDGRTAVAQEMLLASDNDASKRDLEHEGGHFEINTHASDLLIRTPDDHRYLFHQVGEPDIWSELGPLDNDTMFDRTGGGQYRFAGSGWVSVSLTLYAPGTIDWYLASELTHDGLVQTSQSGFSGRYAADGCGPLQCGLPRDLGYASTLAAVSSEYHISFQYDIKGPVLDGVSLWFETIAIDIDLAEWFGIEGHRYSELS